jgi:hypothetical protein
MKTHTEAGTVVARQLTIEKLLERVSASEKVPEDVHGVPEDKVRVATRESTVQVVKGIALVAATVAARYSPRCGVGKARTKPGEGVSTGNTPGDAAATCRVEAAETLATKLVVDFALFLYRMGKN